MWTEQFPCALHISLWENICYISYFRMEALWRWEGVQHCCHSYSFWAHRSGQTPVKVTGSCLDFGQKANKYHGPHSLGILWRDIIRLGGSWVPCGTVLQSRVLYSSFSMQQAQEQYGMGAMHSQWSWTGTLRDLRKGSNDLGQSWWMPDSQHSTRKTWGLWVYRNWARAQTFLPQGAQHT